MTDSERLQKLEQAKTLIREVEFSYPENNPIRRMIYSIMVDNFSIIGIGRLMTDLKENIRRAKMEQNEG